MTPFCAAVVKVLQNTPGQKMHAHALRKILIHQGWGKSPAAMAMHLTMLAYKAEFVTGFINDGNARTFLLTTEGAHWKFTP